MFLVGFLFCSLANTQSIEGALQIGVFKGSMLREKHHDKKAYMHTQYGMMGRKEIALKMLMERLQLHLKGGGGKNKILT